jgi:hypothetical protein
MDLRTRRRKPPAARVGALAAGLLVGLLTMSGPSAAGESDLLVPDARGDGRPDIVRLSVVHSENAAAKVRVRVRNVRDAVGNDLFLYVDPYGDRRRPSFVYRLGLNDEGGYDMRRTRGWDVTRRDLGSCGEAIRLRRLTARDRLVVVRMPFACFSDDGGARFAARVRAVASPGEVVGTPDWVPARRTLSPRFEF